MPEKCTNCSLPGNDIDDMRTHINELTGGATAGSALPTSKKLSWLFNIPRSYVLIFFLVYLTIGVSIYQDYGISWDEPVHREIASVTAKYLSSLIMPDFQPPEFAALPPLAEYGARQYGVVFDLPMYVADLLLGYSGAMPEAYYLRHLCNFLLFYVSVFFFYLIVRNRFESRVLGLIACFFLILSPRIFADSFYGKDIVFLSLFIISIYFFIRYLNRKTLMNSLLFALATALLVDQRITGIFLPFLAVFVTGIDEIKAGQTFNNLPKRLFPVFIYLISFSIFMVLFWPYLWENPVRNFINAFGVMNRFPFTHNVLYLGTFIKSAAVPWHYIPVWILITTPIMYTFFFLIGTCLVIRGMIKNGIKLYSNDGERLDFLFILLLVVPLAAVIILNSALYDGWRHLYFIYAPFLLIAMSGVARLIGLVAEASSRRERSAALFIAVAIMLCIISTSYQMTRYHPFQNVYFNNLAGNNVGQKFELDYWGLSFRRGLEYIVKNDKRPIIGLLANPVGPSINNAIFLEKGDIERLRHANIHQANYFLTNYRWHPQPYKLTNEVYSIIVDNQKILSVFKLR
ncbi:MAG: glycosyltransferase family 39 protein [Deltaproteobacteria bacterium]|nr:glycosyltransferase family 39 protein [Deltaproteobacteria bacterium]